MLSIHELADCRPNLTVGVGRRPANLTGADTWSLTISNQSGYIRCVSALLYLDIVDGGGSLQGIVCEVGTNRGFLTFVTLD